MPPKKGGAAEKAEKSEKPEGKRAKAEAAAGERLAAVKQGQQLKKDFKNSASLLLELAGCTCSATT
jgi:hypothetical protein